MPLLTVSAEAAAACGRLPHGRLAQLDTQEALTAVGNALLPTLPMQVGDAGQLSPATYLRQYKGHDHGLPHERGCPQGTSAVTGLLTLAELLMALLHIFSAVLASSGVGWGRRQPG